MSAARTARRKRIQMKHDPRYNRPTKRDAHARAAKDRAKWEAEKLRQQRAKK